MNQSYVIKGAVLSEKSYKLMESGAYTFLVAKQSTKDQIKKAVEKQFSVKVAKVNVLKRASKAKRVTGTRKVTNTKEEKKALVYLEAGQNIEPLAPTKKKKPESKAKEIKKVNKESLDSSVEKNTKSKSSLFSKLTRSNRGQDK